MKAKKMYVISAAVIMALTAVSCGQEPSPSVKKPEYKDTITSSNVSTESVAETTKQAENADAETAPEGFDRAEDYKKLDEMFFEKDGLDFYMKDTDGEITAKQVSYSDPIVIYDIINYEYIKSADSYAYIVIDTENNKTLGLKKIVNGEPEENVFMTLPECYDEALANGQPIAIGLWDRGIDGFITMVCLSNGELLGEDSDDVKLALDPSRYELEYTPLKAAHQADPKDEE